MKGKITTLFGLLLVAATVSIAQTLPVDSTQSAPISTLRIGPPARAPEKTIEIPLGEGVGRGGHIIVPVDIGGKEHLFFVDTGFGNTVIDSALVETLKDSLGPPLDRTGGTALSGGKVEFATYHPPVFRVGGRQLKNDGVRILTMDMDLVRQAEGRPLEGILGMDILSQYVVRLDFLRRVLELIDPQNFQPPKENTAKNFPLIEANGVPGISLSYAGLSNVWVFIDTGCDGVGTITREALQKIPPTDVVEMTSYQVADASGNVQVKEVTVKRKWGIGDTVFENVPLEIANINVIGLRTLADFVITLDFPQKQVYLESIRREHPAELPTLEFGIGLKDGRFLIHNLNGKEKKLDIQVDDEIIAVDGNDISKTELWAVREQLQKAKSPVVRLKRNGQTHDVTLRHE